MLYYRASMDFYLGRYHWVESLYLGADAAGTALGILQQAAIFRLRILAAPVTLGRITVRQENVLRQTMSYGLPQAWQPPGDVAPWNAVNVTLQNNTCHRQYLIRGLPKQAFLLGNPVEPQVDPSWGEQIEQWCELLISLGFCLKVLDGTRPWYPITSAAPFVTGSDADALGNAITQPDPVTGTSYWALTTQPDPGWPLLDPNTGEATEICVTNVRWTGWKDSPSSGINGTHALLSVAPGTVFVRAGYVPNVSYLGKGRMRLRSMGYIGITQVILGNPCKRNTGRG